MAPEGYSGVERTDVEMPYNVFGMKPGQWSDDTALALCLAESLIQNKGLNGVHLMQSFVNWWYEGYNTPFPREENRVAIGLGRSIKEALEQFIKEKRDVEKGDYATSAGDAMASGNGSLMRNGCIAIFAKNIQEAESLAWKQSKVTHKGDEAAGCCQLMAHLIYKALHGHVSKEKLLDQIAEFKSKIETVAAIAKGEGEWNWKCETFSFNQERLQKDPTYIGSYAPDALAMALHCLYSTDNFEDAVRKAATKGGDADTVGSITAQIAGAIYGASAIPLSWAKAVEQWDAQGEIAARARLLAQVHP
jgi:ADP-ribosyl-[dinitrogen reductase] hydrolase